MRRVRSERTDRTAEEAPTAPPLVVDVDGSLIGGDLLIEGIARLLSASPVSLLALLFWLVATTVSGRAGLKRRIAEAVPLPPDTLALNRAVLEEIATAQAAGRSVWLASASDALAVSPLAETVGAVGCLASDGRTNLAGEAKAAALAARFGEGGFDYIGNERRDLAVWKQARRAIGVGLAAGLARKVRALDGEARFLPGLGGGPRDWFRALRPHQWVKNMLVFAPLAAAHETNVGPYLVAAGVFAALSAVASGTYVLNDFLDLPHDRRHPAKRHRPMAAGKVPLLPVIGIGAALAAGGLILAFWLSAVAGLWVLAYLAVTCAYSLLLKRKIFIDVTRSGHALCDARPRRRSGGVGSAVALAARFLVVPVPRPGHRQAPRRAAYVAWIWPVPPPRPGLSSRRLPAIGRAGRGERLRFSGDSDPLHPESRDGSALCPSAVPVADLSAAALLAGAHGAGRRPRRRSTIRGRRRPADFRVAGRGELARWRRRPSGVRGGAVRRMVSASAATQHVRNWRFVCREPAA